MSLYIYKKKTKCAIYFGEIIKSVKQKVINFPMPYNHSRLCINKQGYSDRVSKVSENLIFLMVEITEFNFRYNVILILSLGIDNRKSFVKEKKKVFFLMISAYYPPPSLYKRCKKI